MPGSRNWDRNAKFGFCTCVCVYISFSITSPGQSFDTNICRRRRGKLVYIRTRKKQRTNTTPHPHYYHHRHHTPPPPPRVRKARSFIDQTKNARTCITWTDLTDNGPSDRGFFRLIHRVIQRAYIYLNRSAVICASPRFSCECLHRDGRAAWWAPHRASGDHCAWAPLCCVYRYISYYVAMDAIKESYCLSWRSDSWLWTAPVMWRDGRLQQDHRVTIADYSSCPVAAIFHRR